MTESGTRAEDAFEEKNKRLVADAYETLFNRRNYSAAETMWADDYIQHSAHIPQGRDGLIGLVKLVVVGRGPRDRRLGRLLGRCRQSALAR